MMKRDFAEFMTCEPVRPSVELTDRVLARIHGALVPSWSALFFRLAVIHVVGGGLSLLLCSQPSLALPISLGLDHQFMRLGEPSCTILCGVLFLSLTGLMAALFLSRDWLRVCRKRELVLFPLLAVMSAGLFSRHGTGLGDALPDSVTNGWLLGAVAGGILMFELGHWVRERFGSLPAGYGGNPGWHS